MSAPEAPAHRITVTDVDALVRVEIDGVLLASSRQVRVLREGQLPPRYYFPRDDVRMDLLEPTSSRTTCPFKGDASYWSAVLDGTRHDDVVWSYESPIESMTAIARRLAFYDDRVTLSVDEHPPDDPEGRSCA